MLVYLDNCIVCGEARGDLSPPLELASVVALRQLERSGLVQLVTSRLSWHEQARARDPLVRATLEAAREQTTTVPIDSKLLGSRMQYVHGGGFLNSPILTDILDSALYRNARALGLKDIDAKHLVHASFNACSWLVTTDPDFTDIASDLEALCAGLRIATPSVAALALGS